MSKILLVDDDDLIQITFQDVLESRGHCVTVANNGSDALRKLSDAAPEILITDLIMPDKDGIELILEVKQLHPNIKIVAISGGGRMQKTELLTTAQKLGADFCLKKPISPKELLAIIDQLAA